MNLKPAANRVHVTFDYFARGEGVVIDVYHTGKGDDLALKGTIKGAGALSKANYDASVFDPIARLLEPFFRFVNRLNHQKGARAVLVLPVLVPLVVIAFVIVVPFATADSIAKFFNRRPKQFSLKTESGYGIL